MGVWERPWWLTFLDWTNLTVTTLTAGFVLYTRSTGVVYFATGALMCSLTVKILKRRVKQPRPPTHPSLRKASYGMPSTHSATITFYATYVTLACIYLPIHRSLPQNSLSRTFPLVVVVPWSMLIAVSRVWLGHHTWPQVAVGCSYGAVFATFWFVLWTSGLSEQAQGLEHTLQSYSLT